MPSTASQGLRSINLSRYALRIICDSFRWTLCTPSGEMPPLSTIFRYVFSVIAESRAMTPLQIARNQIDLMPIAFRCRWEHLPGHLAIGLKDVCTLTDSHILATVCIVSSCLCATSCAATSALLSTTLRDFNQCHDLYVSTGTSLIRMEYLCPRSRSIIYPEVSPLAIQLPRICFKVIRFWTNLDKPTKQHQLKPVNRPDFQATSDVC